MDILDTFEEIARIWSLFFSLVLSSQYLERKVWKAISIDLFYSIWGVFLLLFEEESSWVIVWESKLFLCIFTEEGIVFEFVCIEI